MGYSFEQRDRICPGRQERQVSGQINATECLADSSYDDRASSIPARLPRKIVQAHAE